MPRAGAPQRHSGFEGIIPSTSSGTIMCIHIDKSLAPRRIQRQQVRGVYKLHVSADHPPVKRALITFLSSDSGLGSLAG
ncbi:hypothetical protein EVAR_34554_1 [Eumeta japonica]|uniref:Uncharacterized protein n=1 Tax=Eumeta variegata TaxID=151549 RepID=A0A4C1X6M9_EUMVA|nr:hypothetical protein EVAR_34554_1 [Eumeta japonica]